MLSGDSSPSGSSPRIKCQPLRVAFKADDPPARLVWVQVNQDPGGSSWLPSWLGAQLTILPNLPSTDIYNEPLLCAYAASHLDCPRLPWTCLWPPPHPAPRGPPDAGPAVSCRSSRQGLPCPHTAHLASILSSLSPTPTPCFFFLNHTRHRGSP